MQNISEIDELIKLISKLPGLGPKSAKRIVKGVPVGVGFGISTEKDVKKYVSIGADAVIVGSANIKIMENTPKLKIEESILKFTKKLKRQTK